MIKAKKRNSRKKRYLKEAATNYIVKNGPSTAVDICYYGVTNAGTMLKDQRRGGGVHHAQAFAWLRVDPDFHRLSDNRFRIKKGVQEEE